MGDYGRCRARWLKGKSIRSCSEEATRVIVAVGEKHFGKTDKQLKQRGFIVQFNIKGRSFCRFT